MNEVQNCLFELRKHRDIYMKNSSTWRTVNRAINLILALNAEVDALRGIKTSTPQVNLDIIDMAIQSAKCRVYKLNFDTDGKISAYHQKKAENQKELMDVTLHALYLLRGMVNED